MFKEFLARSSHLEWPLAAFILFFVMFIGVIVILVRGLIGKTTYDREASLPLEDDAPRIDTGGSQR